MRMILKNSLLRNSGLYTITSIINSAIPFLMLPILTRYLIPADYGKISMFSVLVAFLTPLITINLNGAITRNYYEKEEINFQEYIWNSLVIVIVSLTINILVLFILRTYIFKLTQLSSNVLVFALVLILTQFLTNILLGIYQVNGFALKYGVLTIIITIINFSLSILFVVNLNYGWIGRVYGQVLAYVIVSIYSIIIIIKSELIKFDFNKLYIKNALSYGLPLIPHALAGTIFSMTDRLFITNMVGIEETGIYTVGFQVGSIIGILATSFNNAYVPWLYEKLKRNEKKINLKIVKLTYLYFIIILLLSILIGGVSKFLFQVFLGVNYLESAKYVIWIAISFALNGMYFMVVNFIFYAQKNKLLAITTFCASLLNFLFNYLFIKMNGPIGAAQATVLIYFLKFIVVWKLSSKIYRMPWREGLSDFFKIRGDI